MTRDQARARHENDGGKPHQLLLIEGSSFSPFLPWVVHIPIAPARAARLSRGSTRTLGETINRINQDAMPRVTAANTKPANGAEKGNGKIPEESSPDKLDIPERPNTPIIIWDERDADTVWGSRRAENRRVLRDHPGSAQTGPIRRSIRPRSAASVIPLRSIRGSHQIKRSSSLVKP